MSRETLLSKYGKIEISRKRLINKLKDVIERNEPFLNVMNMLICLMDDLDDICEIYRSGNFENSSEVNELISDIEKIVNRYRKIKNINELNKCPFCNEEDEEIDENIKEEVTELNKEENELFDEYTLENKNSLNRFQGINDEFEEQTNEQFNFMEGEEKILGELFNNIEKNEEED